MPREQLSSTAKPVDAATSSITSRLEGIESNAAMMWSVVRIQRVFRSKLLPPDNETLRNRVQIFKARQRASLRVRAAGGARDSKRASISPRLSTGSAASCSSLRAGSVLGRLTLMKHAIKAGNVDVLKHLLGDNARDEVDSVHLHDEDGELLLCLAVRYERTEMIAMLFSTGAKFGDASAWLSAMIDIGNTDVREALIVAGGFLLDKELVASGVVTDPGLGTRWREVEEPPNGIEITNAKLRAALLAASRFEQASRPLSHTRVGKILGLEKIELDKSDLERWRD